MSKMTMIYKFSKIGILCLLLGCFLSVGHTSAFASDNHMDDYYLKSETVLEYGGSYGSPDELVTEYGYDTNGYTTKIVYKRNNNLQYYYKYEFDAYGNKMVDSDITYTYDYKNNYEEISMTKYDCFGNEIWYGLYYNGVLINESDYLSGKSTYTEMDDEYRIEEKYSGKELIGRTGYDIWCSNCLWVESYENGKLKSKTFYYDYDEDDYDYDEDDDEDNEQNKLIINHVIEYAYKGTNVVEIKDTYYNTSGSIESIYIQKFNENGNLISSTRTSSDNKVSGREYSISYGKKGKPSNVICYDISSNGKKKIGECSWNAAGQLLKRKDPVKQTSETWKYNKKGILTKYTKVDGQNKTVITYDANNWNPKTLSFFPEFKSSVKSEGTEVLEKIAYTVKTDKNGVKTITRKEFNDIAEVIKYDKEGHMISSVQYLYPGSSSISEAHTYTYDKYGNITEDILSDNNGVLSITTYKNTYNKNKKLTKVITTLEWYQYGYWNSVSAETTYKYDKKGHTIQIAQNRDLISESIDYKYDKKGNLISQIEKQNGSPVFKYTYKWDKLKNLIA